jgi:glycosyltransferase involved in cell wall biosynthesis
MLLAIHFARLGPYHLARLRSACEVLTPLGWRVMALEIAGSDATYEWEQESGGGGEWERVTVFPNGVFEKIPAGEMKRGIERELNRLRPDAVAIAGWGTVDARACLNWCKRNDSKAIVMSETRAADGRRVWWKEWVKSRIVRRFDAALCGGESHKRYLVQLGMPEGRVALGYNVVDNQFFGRIRNGECWEPGDLTTIERGGRCEKEQPKVGPKGEGAGTSDSKDTTERLGGREMEQPEFGPKGEGVGTTESKSTELEAGACLSGQVGDAFSNPSASELVQDSETPSHTRFADASATSHDTKELLKLTDQKVYAGPYFLASNRFVERKNLGRLLEGYKIFQDSVFRLQAVEKKGVWPLVLLGDGELRGDLEARCAELGLKIAMGFSHEGAGSTEGQNLKLNSYKLKTPAGGGCVVFAGFRQIGELRAFYSGAGAFVHPALEEPWGLVINEAMASGLPVLSSHNVGAAEELVQEGKTGFLFDPRDVNSIAESLFKMFSMSEAARHKMGMEAREMLERKVPSRAFGEGLAKVLGT